MTRALVLGRWKFAEAGMGLIVAAGIGAVLWFISALVVTLPGSTTTAKACAKAAGDHTISFDVQFHWFPLRNECISNGGSFDLTTPAVTILWSLGWIAVCALAGSGVSLLGAAAIRTTWAWCRRRRGDL